MFDIDKAFNPETKSVYNYYQDPGVGFYIPLYQREYSWDKDNIDQLLDDLVNGVENLSYGVKNEIRFLGTIISVKVIDKRKIYPIDPKGLPSTIENIIDGQQRLSTIALFSTLLYKNIAIYQKKLRPSNEEEELFDHINEVCNFWKAKLLDIFSLDLQRGTPNRKPKIIRGNKDQWTKDGDIAENYVSDVASYLAQFINYVEGIGSLPKPEIKSRAGRNASRINRWLRTDIIPSHTKDEGDFIPAWEILENIEHENIVQYERDELKKFITRQIGNREEKSFGYNACSLIQLFSICHYLLDRCCFTIIQPMDEDWAFDMFQSLNATGTPLTAIETFKPNVVNDVDSQKHITFKGSKIEKSFDQIDLLFSNSNNASQKNKLANDFLTSFALACSGEKLESHFSKQRKWLDKIYNNSLNNFDERASFLKFFGHYAVFYKRVWLDYEGQNGELVSEVSSFPEADLACMLIKFLKEANHKMAITILGRFFDKILKKEEKSVQDFIEAVKATSAFYVLWRAASSNAGLDNSYRSFFKVDDRHPSKAWMNSKQITLKDLKKHFSDKLKEKGILEKNEWLKKGTNYLKYSKSKSVCKFALFVSAHDTIPDTNRPGLMKIGTKGTADYLNLKKWNSPDLKTIEHIAPVEGEKTLWDSDLYDENELYQSVGNLTLLPQKANTSASNKGWIEKLIYYEHLSEKDPEKQKALAYKAKLNEIRLKPETIEYLQKSAYNSHIAPIVIKGENLNWDSSLVKDRAERILEIMWDRIIDWILK